jgi:hypothetical protein
VIAQIVQECPEGAILTVHVQPKAARTEYVGIHGDTLKFRVAAPPVEGAANHALCRFLAEQFNLSRSAVVVRSGGTSRRKRVLLTGVPAQRVWEVLSLSFPNKLR